MKISALFLALAATLLLQPSAEAAKDGLRSKQTVLKGALIRAGGAGGQNSITNNTLAGLCEEGVSSAYYLYPKVGFTNKGVHSCGRGTIEYKGGSFNAKGARPILLEVMNAANGRQGPVLVHCWNGWHAAGEVAAYALMQFCGWSGDQAANYWADTIADRRNIGKYGSVLNRIRTFKPYGDIGVTDAVRANICP